MVNKTARLSSEIEFNCCLLQFAHACMHDVVCIYIVGLPKLIIKLRSPAKVVHVNVDTIKKKFNAAIITINLRDVDRSHYRSCEE